MVFLLAMATVMVIITVDIFFRLYQKRRHRLAAEAPAEAVESAGGTVDPYYPQRLLYNHSHAWVQADSATVSVGLDDFVQRLAGPIDRIEAVRAGTVVNKGDPLWTIHFGDRSITQRAPLSGRVTQVNQSVLRDPSLANRAPYGEGWVLEIMPRSLGDESTSLLDRKGFRIWNDNVRAKLLQEMRPELGVVFGDAGQLRPGAGRKMEREKWDRFVNKFFADGE